MYLVARSCVDGVARCDDSGGSLDLSWPNGLLPLLVVGVGALIAVALLVVVIRTGARRMRGDGTEGD